MVGPARKREAVTHVQTTLCTSQRRACSSLDQPRSTQRYQTRRPDVDARLTRAMRRIAEREPRAGYRTVTCYLRREGWRVNRKRVHRLWKKEGLKVPAKARKKRRMGESANGTQRRRAERANRVWSYDFVFDQTETGSRLKWLPVLDEYSRECLSLGSRAQHNGSGRGANAPAARRREGCARVHPLGQRAGICRRCRQGLAAHRWNRHPLH